MPIKERETPFDALREAEATVVEALRELETGLERKLEEVLIALLTEIRRIRELLGKFEVSEEAGRRLRPNRE